MSFYLSDEDEEAILSAIRCAGHARWLGTAADPAIPELTAVWSCGCGKGDLNGWLAAYCGVWTMAFSPERDFAIQGDAEDLLTIAGPAPFLRQALGDLRARWLDFKEGRLLPESEENPESRAYYDAFIGHYEPFIAGA